MPNSTKPQSELDGRQTLQSAYNNSDCTYSVSGYVSSKVGATITRTIVSPTVDDYRFLDVVYTVNGNITSAMNTITGLVGAFANLMPGQYVLNANFPANTTILSVNSDTAVTVSANATGSASASSIQFANLLYLLEVTYDDSGHDNVNMVQRLQ